MYEWRAPSGVHVVSCVSRDDAAGLRGFRAYLAYYILGVGRKK